MFHKLPEKALERMEGMRASSSAAALFLKSCTESSLAL